MAAENSKTVERHILVTLSREGWTVVNLLFCHVMGRASLILLARTFTFQFLAIRLEAITFSKLVIAQCTSLFDIT